MISSSSTLDQSAFTSGIFHEPVGGDELQKAHKKLHARLKKIQRAVSRILRKHESLRTAYEDSAKRDKSTIKSLNRRIKVLKQAAIKANKTISQPSPEIRLNGNKKRKDAPNRRKRNSSGTTWDRAQLTQSLRSLREVSENSRHKKQKTCSRRDCDHI